jgi:hypothetical protein
MGRAYNTNEKNRNACKIFVGKPEGKRPLRREVGGWIILKWILERYDGMVWSNLMWPRIGTSRGFL